MRFKLLTGIHQEGSFHKDGKYYPGKTYEARGYRWDDNGVKLLCGVGGQDIIETDNYLLKHDSPNSVRFERLPDLVATPQEAE